MKRTIIQRNNDDPSSVLRKRAKEILIKDIKSSFIKNLIKDMRETLFAEPDGVALAAPQVAESIRIFIVSPKAFPDSDAKNAHLVYINPRITKLSANTIICDEGCLSVRWKYGKIRRAEKAAIEACDENGLKFSRGASGILAEIFQHEIDHLDGILFTDEASDLHEINPPMGEPHEERS